jgi:hypothetical protein
MRVRCVSSRPASDLGSGGGGDAYAAQDFHITEGQEYLVLGLQFEIRSKLFGTGAWVQLRTDYGRLGWAPLAAFEILDGRVSGTWEVRQWADGGVTLWPPSFYREFYHDDLSEGVPEIVEDLRQVEDRMQREFANGPESG